MDGFVKIGTELDTKSFEKQIVKVKDELDTLEQELGLMKKDKGFDWSEDITKSEAKIETLTNKLTILRTKQADLDRNGLNNINASLEKAGTKVSGVVGKVVKWGLAVFGVRSAYMGIRRVISMVRSENEEIDAGFKAIENFVSTAFEPLVKRLLGWVMTLVQYVNYLAKAWFGVDILAKSNEKSLKGANKQAKELRKTLTGFDEMNVINDSGGTGASSSIGALPIPDDVRIPSWLEWLGKHGEEVAGIIGLIGAAWAGWKFGTLISNMGKLLGKAGTGAAVGSGLAGVASTLALIAGMAVIAITITYLISDSKKLKEDIMSITEAGIKGNKMWKDSVDEVIEEYKKGKKTVDDVYNILNTSMTNLNVKTTAHKDLLSGVSGLTLGLIMSNEERQKQLDSISKQEQVILDAIKKTYETDSLDLAEKQKIVETLNKNFDKNYEITEQMKRQGLNTDAQKETLKQTTSLVGTILEDIKKTDPALAKSLDKYKEMNTKTNSITSNLDKAKSELDDINNTKLKDKNFKVTADAGSTGTGIRKVLNDILAGPRSLLKTFGIKLPYLKSGGIINYPNRGVSVGGGRAIGGESGAEGVIPLTDSQAMETLGQEIGKHINITMIIENKMDGKVISREVKKINQNNDFVMNR